MPVSASRPATRLANAGVDDLAGTDVDGQIGVGERQVASPPAGRAGPARRAGSPRRRGRPARSPRRAAGTARARAAHVRGGASGRAPRSRRRGRSSARRSAGSTGRSRPGRCPGAARWRCARPAPSSPAVPGRRPRRSRGRGPSPGTSPRRRRAAGRRPTVASAALTEKPMLAVMKNSVPSTSTASRIVARNRSATGRRVERVVAARACSTTMNSSPPKRASSVPSPTAPRIRSDITVQQPVADAVAEAVVDRLEVVEVDEQQRHRADGLRRRAARRPATAARCGWAAR